MYTTQAIESHSYYKYKEYIMNGEPQIIIQQVKKYTNVYNRLKKGIASSVK